MAVKLNEQNLAYKKPERIFEDSGAVIPKKSYYIRLKDVTNTRKQDLKTMVDNGRYFSIFAPRQSGKTTYLEAVRRELHEEPTYVIVLLNFQNLNGVGKSDFYNEIQKELYSQLMNRLNDVGCDKCDVIEDFLKNHNLTNHLSFMELLVRLNTIIEFKKIVIFIDEFDGIPLDELENFLTTLRSLHQKYKSIEQKALYSIGLIGIRNITKLIVGGISPFNIADQVDLPPFSLENVRELYAQYTGETNQKFSHEALKRIHEVTGGQPWLVNRLGTILTVDVKPDTVETIDKNDTEKAIQMLLQERNAHFDNIYEKAILFRETFVEIVFDHVEYNSYEDDQSWLEQYGLIKNSGGHAVVTNEIYKRLHLKVFFKDVKAYRETFPHHYQLPGDRLDMKRILLDFEQYITRIGVNSFYQKWAAPAYALVDKEKINQFKPYEKTGQFLLTAWLYQFVRGGAGELHYEVLSGLGRMDVLLSFKGRKYIIETKINRGNIKRTINDGVTQVASKYLVSESAHEGFLIVFDAKSPVGQECDVQYHTEEMKQVTSFTIAIAPTTTRPVDPIKKL